jgi:hypothetical protein
MPRTRKRSIIAIIVTVVACALLAFCFLPLSYLASPRWDVWVVTPDKQPIPGIRVRLVYENYSAENQDHEITLTADENGHVLFPPQYAKASLSQLMRYTLAEAPAFVHASFGRHAYVFAFGNGYEGSAVSGEYITDWTGSPASMKSRIVAQHK